MADKTNSYLLKSLVLFTFMSVDNCLNNTLNDCHCDRSDKPCYEWVNSVTCALMNGKLNNITNCNCCQSCLIQREFLEGCHQSIPGFKFKCREGLSCSRQHGFICIELNQKLLEQILMTIEYKRNPYEDKLISLVPEHQRPLKRVPRMQYKKKHRNYETDYVYDPDISFEKKSKHFKIVENS